MVGRSMAQQVASGMAWCRRSKPDCAETSARGEARLASTETSGGNKAGPGDVETSGRQEAGSAEMEICRVEFGHGLLTLGAATGTETSWTPATPT